MTDDRTLKFVDDEGDEAIFHVLEETKLNGEKYLLVVDDFEDEEEEAIIFKEVADANGEVTYTIVDDERELSCVASVFEELLEDIELQV
ncbi:MAG: DUF1292 domain-containing protein [Lachnospiraceae bacterium]|nr:DUF1292 domain-containing protein [Lachnospiraceae bacterium]